MKSIVGVVILGGLVTGLYFVNDATRSKDGESVLNVAGERPIDVEVVVPERRSIIRVVQAPGDVEPLTEVDISGEVPGKIVAMPVEEGDWVRKGDLLCRLDDVDYRARLTSAEANVARLKATIRQAEADLDKALRDFKRQVRLSEADATSSVEIADYRTTLIRSEAALDIRRQELIEVEAMLKSARENVKKTVITAPIDGIVSQLFAEAGEVVITGTMNNPGTRIMVISDLSKMQVRCRVDESDAPLVKNDQAAHIYLQSDLRHSIRGRVLRVASKGTKPPGRDVVTFETLVLVEEDDERVKPGMSANVEIEVDRSANALVVPVESVVHRKRRDLPEDLVASADARLMQSDGRRRGAAEYLMVLFAVDGDTAQPRLIDTGISDETGVEIVSGVAPGETIVTGPYRSLDQLKSGKKVKIKEDEKKAGSEQPVANEEPVNGTLAEK